MVWYAAGPFHGESFDASIRSAPAAHLLPRGVSVLGIWVFMVQKLLNEQFLFWSIAYLIENCKGLQKYFFFLGRILLPHVYNSA